MNVISKIFRTMVTTFYKQNILQDGNFKSSALYVFQHMCTAIAPRKKLSCDKTLDIPYHVVNVCQSF